MAGDYWDKYWASRSSRRRFLGAAGATGVGAAGLALVGCGDDDDDSGGGTGGLATPTSGAQASPTPADPFASAKKGGVYKLDAAGDPPTIDPFGNLSFLTKTFCNYSYSRLFKFKAGPGIAAASVRPTGDLAASVENTPDGLTWTVKLRPDVKFHNVAPVNGRAVTTDDVKFSWGRATDEKNTNRAQLAFVDKVEYPDQTTIKFTLKNPNVAFPDVLADTNLLYIMPTESGGGFDPATKMIGSGPWIFDSYQPSVAMKFKKNPDWYEKGFPLMDGIDVAIVPEYASRLAQFLAGNTDTAGIAAVDLVDTKKRLNDVQLYGEVAQLLCFMFMDSDPASPWRDERVRQAISMGFDRDALTDLGYDIKKLRAGGIDAKDPWNNLIPAGMTRWWLDPKSKEQGETAKYFKYDIAEAKKLLSAAGHPNGFEATYQYTANRYGKTFNDLAEATSEYLRQGLGLKLTTDVQDYSSKYITQTFVGNFKGIAFGYQTPFPEGGSYPLRMFTDNPNNHGKVNDPKAAELAVKQQREPSEEKRKEIFWEIQRYNAEKMYYIPNQAGAATGWTGHLAHMRNAVEYVTTGYGAPTEAYPYRWKNV
jgi:peptide/nickel transport system substrate-binding protein